jgi:hypothetical protein
MDRLRIATFQEPSPEVKPRVICLTNDPHELAECFQPLRLLRNSGRHI